MSGRHVATIHKGGVLTCSKCPREFPNTNDLMTHFDEAHMSKPTYESDCTHERRVYSGERFCSYPSQWFWACLDCPDVGTTTAKEIPATPRKAEYLKLFADRKAAERR